MKRSLLFFLSLFLLSLNISAQKTKQDEKKGKEKSRLENLSPQARHDAYVQMSNNQKLLGWFTLGLGGSMILGGSAKMVSESFKGVPKTDIRLIWLPAAGVLATVGSYFIIKNSKEKRQKASLILEQESAHIGHPQHLPFSYPTFGIKINIR